MFDKNRFVNNIYTLAKSKNKKIGDLESNSGVSIGYLKRLLKPENNSSPTIETIQSFAKELGVPLIDIIEGNFSKLNVSEQRILGFVKKLNEQTNSNLIQWESEMLKQQFEIDPMSGYPIPVYPAQYDFVNNYISTPFYSHYRSDIDLNEDKTDGYCYKTVLDKVNMKILLVPVFYSTGNEVELYTIRNDKLSPICSSGFVADEIAIELRKLRDTVIGNSYIQLDGSVKDGIENYINDIEIPYFENDI